MIYYGTKLSDNITETPEGFLVCHDVIIARTGMQEYAASEVPVESKDGAMIQIHRSKDEVLRTETLASFEGKPVTANHPEGFVTPDNWNDLAMGFTTNIRAVEDGEDGYIMADLMITNKDAIIAVRDGLREVSCGYEADYTDNGDGTGAQKGILGNHVALVPRGRCGSQCAIKDSQSKHKGDNMTFKEKFIDALSKVFDSVEGEDPEVKDEEVPATNGLEEISKKLDLVIEALGKLAGLEATEATEMDAEEEVIDKCDEVTADTIARAEIIAPGIAKDGDVKSKAMDAFSATVEGQEIIGSLNGVTGDALFIAVSELLKAKRNATMMRPMGDSVPNQMIMAEDLNKKYADFWATKK
jgi:hypothetical protein